MDAVEDDVAELARLYPDQHEDDLYEARLTCERLRWLMALAPPEWWVGQNVRDVPPGISDDTFRGFVELGLDLEDMLAVDETVPAGPHRLPLVAFVLSAQELHPQLDLRDFAGFDFPPCALDLLKLRTEEIAPCMRRLCTAPCALCRENDGCSACGALAQTGVFVCGPGFHLCGACSFIDTRPLADGRVLKQTPLRGCSITADGIDYSFTKPLAVAWAAEPVDEVFLLQVGDRRYLWAGPRAFIRVDALVYWVVETRLVQRGIVTVRDVFGNSHRFTARTHNGDRVAWWAVVERFVCRGTPEPEFSNLRERYVAWGDANRELGRAQVPSQCCF